MTFNELLTVCISLLVGLGISLLAISSCHKSDAEISKACIQKSSNVAESSLCISTMKNYY